MNRANVHVALLRGINVGGKNRLGMVELRSALAALGLENVSTYLQSGNVVFESPGGVGRNLAARIERQVADAFEIDAAVLLRTAAELAEIAGHNPFLGDEADPTRLHVVFLDTLPVRAAVAKLDPQRSPPDAFSPRGREIYVHYPNGSGRSKLTVDYFERRLGVRASARNWKTVTSLLALTNAA
jgi:uncharacterized protein (DUF1697 family)